MIRRLAVAALIALATPSLAEEMTMTEAAAAASLHEGPLDVLAYREPGADGAVEVTASFAPRVVTMMSAAPTQRLLALRDGEDQRVSVPGYPQVLYRFLRHGPAVTISARRVAGPALVASGL